MKDLIVWEFRKKFNKKNIFIISAATWEWLEELKDFLIDNYSGKQEKLEEINEEEIKIFNLKEQVKNPKHIDITYEWNLVFKASWERLEQIIRMTDFDNKEAVLRVYDVLEKMWVIEKVEKKLEKIMDLEDLDNSFFFEWNETSKDFSPKIIIWEREILLNNLKYNL
jgi:hypothetical protein